MLLYPFLLTLSISLPRCNFFFFFGVTSSALVPEIGSGIVILSPLLPLVPVSGIGLLHIDYLI